MVNSDVWLCWAASLAVENSAHMFTAIQHRVMDCLLEAMSIAESAQHLGLKTVTIKRHLQRMAKKRGIDSKRFHVRVRLVWLHYNPIQ
jgi:predicted ArsR family transcriptional regulator